MSAMSLVLTHPLQLRFLAVCASAVTASFEVDGERAAADVVELVSRLHGLGLVDRVDPS